MSEADWVDIDRLRALVQDAHINFLIGAGTSSQLFSPLGDVEIALTAIERADASDEARQLARASVQALFFDSVVWPNVDLVSGRPAPPVISSYAKFGKALNRLLLARHSTLLAKHVSLFTTNIDLAVEVAFEQLGVVLNDGFSGRFKPTFDPGSFGSLRQRTSPRYEHRSEVPVFDLIKLHGSVGWHWQGDAGDIPAIGFDRDLALVHEVKEALDGVRDGLVVLPSPVELDAAAILKESAEHDQPAGLDTFVTKYADLVIVNPEKTKFATTVLTETYYELIRRFANELERETSVLFVHGFSFRDEHLRTLVTRAARTNPTLQVFVFCFAQADELAYRELIPETAVPNGNLEYLVPPDDASRFALDAVVDRVLGPILDGRAEEASDEP